MREELFPKEIIENTQESNFSNHSVTSKIIYSTIVFSIICLFTLLPFIEVDVGVRSQGIIRPVTEVIKLSSPVSGQIEYLNAIENSFISKDQIIAKFDASVINERIRYNRSRRDQLSFNIRDITKLQKFNPDHLHSDVELETARYRKSLLEFRQQLINQQEIIKQQERILERETILYNRNATSTSVLENHQYTLQSEKNRLQLIIDQQRIKWHLDEVAFIDELSKLESEYLQLSEELTQYEIRSPVSGTIQNISNISANSFVFANQPLGEISPDTNLVAEVYISPKDIGLLRVDMPVRFQIDAYNYNQWGIATGQIQSISDDIIVVNNSPVFKVQCKLDQNYLELANGFRGQIRKGMTFQARFIINRRSLFQLFYDKVDDWINPAWA
jgi:multidrug efflux pump subunit AcrA (membrane-fusion protein)